MRLEEILKELSNRSRPWFREVGRMVYWECGGN